MSFAKMLIGLQLAVVVDLEIVAAEVGHEAAFGVGHGHIDRHGAGAGAEDRLLGLLRGKGDGEHDGGRYRRGSPTAGA